MHIEPAETIAVPESVAALARNRRLIPCWRNLLGGLTFADPGHAPPRYLKWAPAGSGLDLRAEAERLAWASAFAPVPEVLGFEEDEAGSVLVTVAIDGESAVAPRWRAEPLVAVRAIGSGLRLLHEALPVAGCPFSWDAPARLRVARERAAKGALQRGRWHPDIAPLGIEGALARAAEIPDIDRHVVCHNDACAPNTLLDADGRYRATVDLGQLGTADRWADLAVATWSTQWNYGPGFERALLDAYGVEPDAARTEHYRLLWELDP